jgi:hypothetical protein
LIELQLAQLIEFLAESSAVVQPLLGGLMQGAGQVDEGAFALVSDGQIEGAMQVSLLAAAGGFATGACPPDQGAGQEGLIGDELGELGASGALLGGAMGPVFHDTSWEGNRVLTCNYTLRGGGKDKGGDECEFAQPK